MTFSMPSPLSMLKVPRFNRYVSFALNMSKKLQRNLYFLFTMKDLSRSLLTSQKKLTLHPSVKSPCHADVDDDEDYDEGFEDEDYD